MRALGHFVRRHATLILFVITLGALALIYENQQNLIDHVAAQQKDDQKAACQASLTARADSTLILEQVVEAIPNQNLANKLELAIAHAFDEPPATCAGVDLTQP